MSWIEREKLNMTITCGDKKTYTPKYVQASVSKNVNYNIARFEFKNVEGSLVKRGTAQGRQYDYEIIFDGTDNIEQANAFEQSAKYVNPGTGFADPWAISHPYYDTLYVQPVSLLFDDTMQNRTIIKGQLIETITNSKIAYSPRQRDVIAAMGVVANQAYADAYVANIPAIPAADLSVNTTYCATIFDKISNAINAVQDNYTAYLNAYTAYNAAISEGYLAVSDIINATKDFISIPAYFTDTVVNRVGMFELQVSLLYGQVTNILSAYNRTTAHAKRLYEAMAGNCIAGVCIATMTNVTNDYDYRVNTLSIMQRVITLYNTYLDNVNSLQSVYGGEIDSYIPDPAAFTILHDLVQTTVGALYDAATKAKQQRVLKLVYDDNIITVAYKLYGLLPDDSTIMQLIDNNNIGLNELLVLKAGRELYYYV